MTNSKTLPQIKEIDWLIAGAFISLALVLCLIQYSNIDLEIQTKLFDQENNLWLVNGAEPIKRFFFYVLPKVIFVITTISLIVIFFRTKKPSLLLILLGLILIPLIAGNIKKFTNIYCPNHLKIYGGNTPYVRVFESYPKDFTQKYHGQCFPAGHCVTGFALMILFFALRDKKQRIWGLLSSLIIGWILGFYQMAKGAHFFGDTLVSMIVCFILAALIYRFSYRFLDSKNDK